jgi:ethanolamine transporter EutH
MPLPAVLIFGTLASAYVCYIVAKERHANARFWVWAGVLLGPFAIPFVFFSKPAKSNK